MKSPVLIPVLLIIIILTTILTGCKKKEDNTNPVDVGKIPSIANSTIDTLLRIYTDPHPGDSVVDTLGGGNYNGLIKITGNYIVAGIVAADDRSGNIYKKLYIQNATAGIAIILDKVGLFMDFPIGQKVYVKCKVCI
jgi:hypothetical protein